MNLLLYIVIATAWGVSGFMWGRVYEMRRGVNKKLLDLSMKGWGETEVEFLKLVDWMQENGFMARKDGSIKSPYQVHHE